MVQGVTASKAHPGVITRKAGHVSARGRQSPALVAEQQVPTTPRGTPIADQQEIVSVKDVFDKYDRDGSGYIDMQEFHYILADSGILKSMSAAQVSAQLQAMFQAADKDMSGHIGMEEFANFFWSLFEQHKASKGAAGTWAVTKVISPEFGDHAGLQAVFRSYAQMGTNDRRGLRLNNSQWVKLCQDCQLVGGAVTRQAVEVIFAQARPKFERTMRYASFIDALSLIAAAKEVELGEVVIGVVHHGPFNSPSHKPLAGLPPKIQQIFMTYDRSGKGTIPRDEVAYLLADLGVLEGMDEGAAGALLEAEFAHMDVDQDGEVSPQEFYIYFNTLQKMERVKLQVNAAERVAARAQEAAAVPDLAEDKSPVMESLKKAYASFCALGNPSAARAGASPRASSVHQHLMDGKRWARLCRDCSLIGPGLSTASCDIIFARCKPRGDVRMGFPHFWRALDRVAACLKQRKEQVINAVVAQRAPATPDQGPPAPRFRYLNQQRDEECRRIFRAYDIDGSDSLDHIEVTWVLADMGMLDGLRCSLAGAVVDSEYDKMDADGKGGVSYNEFAPYFHSMMKVQKEALLQQHMGGGPTAPGAPAVHIPGEYQKNRGLINVYQLYATFQDQTSAQLSELREAGLDEAGRATFVPRLPLSQQRPAGEFVGAHALNVPTPASTPTSPRGIKSGFKQVPKSRPVSAPTGLRTGLTDRALVPARPATGRPPAQPTGVVWSRPPVTVVMEDGTLRSAPPRGTGAAGSSGREDLAPPELMTAQQWRKLVREAHLLDVHVSASGADVIFARCKPKGAREIGYEHFLLALAHLAAEKQTTFTQVAKAVIATRHPRPSSGKDSMHHKTRARGVGTMKQWDNRVSAWGKEQMVRQIEHKEAVKEADKMDYMKWLYNKRLEGRVRMHQRTQERSALEYVSFNIPAPDTKNVLSSIPPRPPKHP